VAGYADRARSIYCARAVNLERLGPVTSAMFTIAVVNIKEPVAIVRANGATTLLIVAWPASRSRDRLSSLGPYNRFDCLMRGIDATTRQVKGSVGDRVGLAISVMSPLAHRREGLAARCDCSHFGADCGALSVVEGPGLLRLFASW
jgi:hypothetical protein